MPKNAESLGVSNGHLECPSLQRVPRPAKAELESGRQGSGHPQAVLPSLSRRPVRGARLQRARSGEPGGQASQGRGPFVTPGKPSVSSEIWKRAGIEKDMPPSGEKPSDSEREVLRQWIVAGAIFPRETGRKPIGDGDVLKTIVDHLRWSPLRRPAALALFHAGDAAQQPQGPRLQRLRLALGGGLEAAPGQPEQPPADCRPRSARPRSSGPGTGHGVVSVGMPRTVWSQVLKVYPYGLTYKNRPSTDRRPRPGR